MKQLLFFLLLLPACKQKEKPALQHVVFHYHSHAQLDSVIYTIWNDTARFSYSLNNGQWYYMERRGTWEGSGTIEYDTIKHPNHDH